MAGYPFSIKFSFTLLFTLAIAQSAWSQTDVPPDFFWGHLNRSSKSTDVTTPVTKVYALSELGDDPNLCKWIAETIPQMIQPGSWSNAEGKKNLSYYAPGKVIVICHTPAVHTQVDEFIQGLKKAMPARVKQDGQVVPAQFAAPDAPRVGPLSAAQAYPIPQPAQTPKHLFHFIIRYEGEGIIDSNVVKFAQALKEASKADKSSTQDASVPETFVPASRTLPTPQYLNPAPQYIAPTNAPKMPLADSQPRVPETPGSAPAPIVPPPSALPSQGSR